MNNKLFPTALIIILMAAAMNNAAAQWQPQVDYPNPNYLYYPELPRCPEKMTPGCTSSNMIIALTDTTEPSQTYYPWIMACPFLYKTEDSTKTITLKGVATSLRFIKTNDPNPREFSHTAYFDHDITVVIYKGGSVGTAELQRVKEQTFHIASGKEPDIIVKYPIYQGTDEISPSYDPSAPERYNRYYHEFYFDQPVTVQGYFIIMLIENCPRWELYYEMERDSPEVLNQRIYGGLRYGAEYECRFVGFTVAIDYMQDTIKWYQYNGDVHVRIPDVDSTGPLTTDEQMYFPILASNNIEQPKAQSGLRVHPNPTSGSVHVESEEGLRHIEVTDMAGRTFIRRPCDGTTRSVTLDISHLPRGTYAVRAKTERTSATEKLVVQ